MKLLLTKGPDLYTSHKGNRTWMYFLRTTGLCPHSSPKNTGKTVYFLPCLKAEQDLDKVHFPKPNSAMLSWNKGHWSFTPSHPSSSASRKVKLLCASQLLIFPQWKSWMSVKREHMILSEQKIASIQQALPWQAYHSEFNEMNLFRHQCYLVVLSRSLCPKPSQEDQLPRVSHTFRDHHQSSPQNMDNADSKCKPPPSWI